MLRVGLTGGIGCGKSTVARMFAARGAATVDADAIAHELQAPGRPAYARIIRAFGPEILDAEGRIDRWRLGALVFADADRRADLEAIMHPLIQEACQARMRDAAATGAAVCLVEAALLVETGAYRRFDRLVVVVASEGVQVERLVARGGLTGGEALARLRAQLPLEAKRRVADWVVDNSGSLDETERQVSHVWSALRAAAAAEKT